MSTYRTRIVYDQKKVANRRTQGLVQIELRIGTHKAYFTTGIKVFPSQWVELAHKVRGTMDDDYCNHSIEATMANVENAVRSATHDGELTIAAVKQRYTKAPVSRVDDFIDYMILTLRQRTELTPATVHSHTSFIRKIQQYGIFKTFADLTRENIEAFDRRMKQEGMAQSSRAVYHGTLKSYINIARREGRMTARPYEFFPIARGKGKLRKYLTEDELQRVANCNLVKKSYAVARDLFLLQCYTGMAYVDINATDWRQLKNVTNGKYVIRGKRQKTGVPYYTVVLPEAMNILKRYKFAPRVPPFESYARQLSKIADIAGVKHITSHMGRHTFATLCLRAGVPIESLARMMGHTDIKTTQIYAKVLDSAVEDGFAKLEGFINNKPR
jgi:integrase/recombinase XerD